MAPVRHTLCVQARASATWGLRGCAFQYAGIAAGVETAETQCPTHALTPATPPTLVPSAEIKEKAGPKQAAPRLAPIAPAPKPTPPPSPAPVPAPAPTPVVPLAGSVTYEVQNCGSDCDYPCNRDCGQTWEDCYVVQEYSGTYDLKLAEDNEVIHGVLKRHVRRKGEVQPQTKRLRGATRLS